MKAPPIGIRLRFWLRAMDLTLWLHWDWAWWISLRHMAALADWGEGADLGDEPPWEN
jgi:hypothetical protein